jgi:hypothetical protein
MGPATRKAASWGTGTYARWVHEQPHSAHVRPWRFHGRLWYWQAAALNCTAAVRQPGAGLQQTGVAIAWHHKGRRLLYACTCTAYAFFTSGMPRLVSSACVQCTPARRCRWNTRAETEGCSARRCCALRCAWYAALAGSKQWTSHAQ